MIEGFLQVLFVRSFFVCIFWVLIVFVVCLGVWVFLCGEGRDVCEKY